MGSLAVWPGVWAPYTEQRLQGPPCVAGACFISVTADPSPQPAETSFCPLAPCGHLGDVTSAALNTLVRVSRGHVFKSPGHAPSRGPELNAEAPTRALSQAVHAAAPCDAPPAGHERPTSHTSACTCEWPSV